MGKVKSKVASQKLQTIEHQTWQVPGFQILRALSYVIMDRLQDRLKMGIIDTCKASHRNPWYLVTKSKK